MIILLKQFVYNQVVQQLPTMLWYFNQPSNIFICLFFQNETNDVTNSNKTSTLVLSKPLFAVNLYFTHFLSCVCLILSFLYKKQNLVSTWESMEDNVGQKDCNVQCKSMRLCDTVTLMKMHCNVVHNNEMKTWTLSYITSVSYTHLDVYKRQVLRRIYGPVRENNIWRRLHNQELYERFKDLPIVQLIQINRLRWVGHVQRIAEDRIPKKKKS